MDTQLQQAINALKVGPLEVVWNPGASQVELFVKDGVDLSISRGMEEVELDIIGVQGVVSQGDGIAFDLAFPEISASVVRVMFLNAREGTDVGKTYTGIGNEAGYNAYDDAQEIRIRPWRSRTDRTLQIRLWKVAPAGDISLAMRKTDPHTWTCSFRAFPDPSRPDGDLLGRVYAGVRA